MKNIIYQIKNHIAYITLNRPEKRNALNDKVVSELQYAFDMAEKDDTVAVIILKANGSAFCAGADLAYLQQLQQNTYEENLEDSRRLKELFYSIYTLSKVVIVQIEGHAIAGGCGLVTVCDFSFAVPEAKFGYTEVRIGFVPAIVKVFLLRKTDDARARRLLLTGELVSAEEAGALGLITEVAAADRIEDRVEAFARMLITQNSSQAMASVKQMMARVQSMSLEEGLDYAAESNARARTTSDCRKGIAAFLSKEPVDWGSRE